MISPSSSPHISPNLRQPLKQKCRAAPKLQLFRWLWQHRVLFLVNVFTRDVFPPAVVSGGPSFCGLFTFTSFHRGDVFLSEWEETKLAHWVGRPWQEINIWFPGLAVNLQERGHTRVDLIGLVVSSLISAHEEFAAVSRQTCSQMWNTQTDAFLANISHS